MICQQFCTSDRCQSHLWVSRQTEITMTSSNLGRTISLIVVKGRLGAAQGVNASQVNQRFTLTCLFVLLLKPFLSSSKKGAQWNGSVNEDTRTSRTFASISAVSSRCVRQTVQRFLLVPTTCVRCWQSDLCFRVQEHWDSSRFSQSTPAPLQALSSLLPSTSASAELL